MKITLVIEADPENLLEVAQDAVFAAVNGAIEGTYTFPNKGEFRLWCWQVGEVDECHYCDGSGFIKDQ